MDRPNDTRTSTSPHPRDISAGNLEIAIAAQADASGLLHLVELSRTAFGFYTSHFPHTINYPWIADRLADLPAGARVLDIGAGVSPLPLFLAEKNVLVDCVDHNREIRRLPVTPDWNEWGFFDYGALNPNLTSHHCDITTFTPAVNFNAIYSIAALAHMPRVVREKTLRLCHEWLRPRGAVLLAIDVIPATDFLWNRSQGREVEPPMQHGTIDDVTAQLQQLGFRIDECKVMRTVYQSRTDLLFIAATKDDPDASSKLEIPIR